MHEGLPNFVQKRCKIVRMTTVQLDKLFISLVQYMNTPAFGTRFHRPVNITTLRHLSSVSSALYITHFIHDNQYHVKRV